MRAVHARGVAPARGGGAMTAGTWAEIRVAIDDLVRAIERFTAALRSDLPPRPGTAGVDRGHRPKPANVAFAHRPRSRRPHQRGQGR